MENEKKQMKDPSSYTSMKNCNLLISAVSAILGLGIIVLSFQLGFGSSKTSGLKAGTWPGIMGMGILLFAVVLLIYTLKNAEMLSDMDYTDAHGDHLYRVSIHLWENIQVYKMVLMILVYIVLLSYFGMYISSLILLPALMWFLMPEEKQKEKKKSMIQTLVIDVCVVLAVYLIFEVVLGTQLPKPFWV